MKAVTKTLHLIATVLINYCIITMINLDSLTPNVNISSSTLLYIVVHMNISNTIFCTCIYVHAKRQNWFHKHCSTHSSLWCLMSNTYNSGTCNLNLEFHTYHCSFRLMLMPDRISISRCFFLLLNYSYYHHFSAPSSCVNNFIRLI